MRRLVLLILLLMVAAGLYAQTDTTGGSAAHGAEAEAHKVAHPGEEPHKSDESEQKFFGFIPGWFLKLLNMILFIGVLGYFLRGPVATAFTNRAQQIRAEAEEAKARRAKADQLASDIQNRLTQIEQEIRTIREKAEVEGERQRREMIAAAEAEAAKIIQNARNEVDNRLKHAREELTAYAGELASERAESILRERLTDADRTKLFNDSLKEIEVARS